MFDVYQFSEPKFLAFILVLLRMIAFIVSSPIFGVGNIPVQLKLLLSLTLTFILFPIVSWRDINGELLSNEIIWLAGREVFIGLCLGFLSKLFFFAVSSGGMLISISIGLSSAQMFNPAIGEQSSVVEQLKVTLATLFFLAINGHHMLLSALVQSFTLVPLSTAGLNLQVFRDMAALGQEVLLIGVKIAAPIMISVLLMNLAMGILGRAVPQINVLITSWSANILLGFLVLFVCLPFFFDEMKGTINTMTLQIFDVMKAW